MIILKLKLFYRQKAQKILNQNKRVMQVDDRKY